MATVDYLPIANTGDANVESQADYVAALGAGGNLEEGYQSGLVRSTQFNKTVRQSSVMTAALANLVSQALGGVDVLDNGNVTTLVSLLRSAVLRSCGMRSIIEYGAKCDGVTFDDDAIALANANAPRGCIMLVPGVCKVRPGRLLRGDMNWINPAAGDCFFIDPTGTVNPETIDGLTLQPPAPIAPPTTHQINVYGPEDCCKDALVIQDMYETTVIADGKPGGAGYSYHVKGCLNATLSLRESSNWLNGPPVLPIPPEFSKKQLCLELVAAVGCNVCRLDVSFALPHVQVDVLNQSLQGNSFYRGIMQGPKVTMNISGALGFIIHDLHYEVADPTSAITFIDCVGCRFENVFGNPVGWMVADNCQNQIFDNTMPNIWIKDTSDLSRVRGHFANSSTIRDESSTTVYESANPSSSSRSVALGGSSPDSDNLFVNPFWDIWPGGAVAAPTGASAVNATLTRDNTTVLSPATYSCVVTNAATVLTQGPAYSLLAPFASYNIDRYVAFAGWIYVVSGQPNVNVYSYDGNAYEGVKYITEKDEWVPFTGVRKVLAGRPFTLEPKCTNDEGSTFTAGIFRVGPLNMRHGVRPPSPWALEEGEQRRGYLVTSIANAPGFVGQRALVGGVFYNAKGTASGADWV